MKIIVSSCKLVVKI